MTKKGQSTKEVPVKALTKKYPPSRTVLPKAVERSNRFWKRLGRSLRAESKMVSKEKLTLTTKLSPKTIANTLPKLQRAGLLEYPQPKMVRLTEKAMEMLGDLVVSGSTNEEVHDKIKASLSPKAVTLFEALINGKTYDKDEIARKLDNKDGRKTRHLST